MADVKLYRTYRFIDKDPVIDEIRTLIHDEGLSKKLEIVHQLSGVATATIHNWLHGDTVSPQNRTICAVTSSLGYERKWTRSKKIDIDQELKVAAAWLKRQNSGQPKKKSTSTHRGRSNGHAGHHRAQAH